MGVNHSLDQDQVTRVGNSLQGGADAIMDISARMDRLENYVKEMKQYNEALSVKIDNTTSAIERIDKTLNERIDRVLVAMAMVTEGTPERTNTAIEAIRSINVQEAVANANKAMVPLTIPFIVLLVELAVSNSYLGILLASLPEVREKYSTFLVTNAGAVLSGLTIGLVCLAAHRWRQNYLSEREDDDLTAKAEGIEEALTDVRANITQASGEPMSPGSPPGADTEEARHKMVVDLQAQIARLEVELANATRSDANDGSLDLTNLVVARRREGSLSGLSRRRPAASSQADGNELVLTEDGVETTRL